MQYSLIPKRVADYFIQIIRDIVYHRERYHITEKGITQSLIGLLKKGYTEDGNRTREEVDSKIGLTMNLIRPFYTTGVTLNKQNITICTFSLVTVE